MSDIDSLEKRLIENINKCANLETLEQIRLEVLGKKGELTLLLKEIGNLDLEKRKERAFKLNLLKNNFLEKFNQKKSSLELVEFEKKVSGENVDVTLPINLKKGGRIHPVTQVTDEIISIFTDLDFDVVQGPDVENEYYNFEALNIPANHPARDLHDTFYLEHNEGKTQSLLRTHTSPVQVRAMEKSKPPFRIIVPGRTYRCDSDMTHTPMFHQLEGLVIDEKTNMGDLKGCLDYFVKSFFETNDVKMRFRPSYFPFTEPSAEVDIGYSREKERIIIGGKTNWLEILGCGMVHPNVLENVNIDSNKYQGYAWGIGIDRLAMLKYGITDLRSFFENDLRWLHHYGFLPFDIPSISRGLSR